MVVSLCEPYSSFFSDVFSLRDFSSYKKARTVLKKKIGPLTPKKVLKLHNQLILLILGVFSANIYQDNTYVIAVFYELQLGCES